MRNSMRALRAEAPSVVAGLLALLAFALAAWQAVVHAGIQRLDGVAAQWAGGVKETLPGYAETAAWLGANELVLPGFLGLGAVLWARGHRTEAAVTAILPIALQAAVHALKLAFELGRPDGSLVATLGYGFPSGHTANAVATGLLLSWLAVRRRLMTRGTALAAAVAYALFMGIGRMAGGAHYLTDVIGGATLAAGLCALALAGASAHERRSVPIAVPVSVSPGAEPAAERLRDV